jgi:hypothetical protein
MISEWLIGRNVAFFSEALGPAIIVLFIVIGISFVAVPVIISVVILIPVV